MKKDLSGNIIKTLKNFFSKEKDVLFCYLFGSFSYQNFNTESDIDIAVFLDEKKIKNFFQKRLELIAKLSRLLKKETDVIILNDQHSLFFKYVILKEGKLIFERNPEKRIDFELKTLNEYFDFKPYLEMYRRRILST